MKYFIFAVLGLLTFSGAALAADKTDGISSGLAVESLLCKRTNYNTSGDVAYQSGIDVNGNPVTPADGGTVVTQSSYTEVPLNVDLARKLNLNQLSEAQMTVASLRIYNDGRVLYNGQDITQQSAALCGGQAVPPPSATMPPPQTVTTMPSQEVPMPGSAAPSSTTPAR